MRITRFQPARHAPQWLAQSTLVGIDVRADDVFARGSFSAIHRLSDDAGNTFLLKIAKDGPAQLSHAIAAVHNGARVLQQLSEAAPPPNIVTYYGEGELDSGQNFLAMEWIEGRNLLQHMHHLRCSREEGRSPAPLDPRSAVIIMRALASALACLHDQNLCYLDWSLKNIMLARCFLEAQGESGVKLIDLDMTRPVGQILTEVGETGSTLIFQPYFRFTRGTVDWAPVDKRHDLAALGLIFFKIYTGQAPLPLDELTAETRIRSWRESSQTFPSRLTARGFPDNVRVFLERLTGRGNLAQFPNPREIISYIDTELISSVG